MTHLQEISSNRPSFAVHQSSTMNRGKWIGAETCRNYQWYKRDGWVIEFVS